MVVGVFQRIAADGRADYMLSATRHPNDRIRAAFIRRCSLCDEIVNGAVGGAATHCPDCQSSINTPITPDSYCCPIGLEPVIVGGITCLGRLYDYRCIKRWLKTHNTEPLTNEVLPSTDIKKVYGVASMSSADISKLCVEIRDAHLVTTLLAQVQTDFEAMYQRPRTRRRYRDFTPDPDAVASYINGRDGTS